MGGTSKLWIYWHLSSFHLTQMLDWLHFSSYGDGVSITYWAL